MSRSKRNIVLSEIALLLFGIVIISLSLFIFKILFHKCKIDGDSVAFNLLVFISSLTISDILLLELGIFTLILGIFMIVYYASMTKTGVISKSTIEIVDDKKTSRFAITSLVLMIMSFFTLGLTILPAIIFGMSALIKIRESRGRLKGKGLAIAGIAAPIVLIPLFLVIKPNLMPALFSVRARAHQMICESHMHNLGKAMFLYASKDQDEKFPTGSHWCDLLIKYADVAPEMFVCKAAKQGPCNYAMNKSAVRLGMAAPNDMILLFESQPGWNQVGGRELLTTSYHRGDGYNVLFCNFHVEFVRSEDINNLKWISNED